MDSLCKPSNVTYNSLLQGRSIRLLDIEPLDQNEHFLPLKVLLKEEHLDKIEFDALSYVWGDQNDKRIILCNGGSYSIGQNLHEALVEYRRRGPKRLLWVDAVCINQECNDEKTQQVRMMRDIYGAASRTIIWLGPLQHGDAEGIHLAKMVYDKCQTNDYHYDEDSFLYNDFDCTARGVPDVLDGPDINPSWRALFNILTHRWFSRIWIVQELLVSRDALMWRGGESMETDVMLWMANQIGGKRDLRQSLGITYESPTFHARAIALCRYRYKKSDPYPIWITMSSTIGMEATDIRDRYFALAGISADHPSDFVNYSRTLEQIASQVGLMTLLGSPNGLDYLVDLPSLRLQSRQVCIPSWVPDFLSSQSMGLGISLLYSTTMFRLQNNAFPCPEFRIITKDSEESQPQMMLPRSPYLYFKVQEMHIKSVIFDTIKAVVPPIPEEQVISRSDQGPGIFTVDIKRHFEHVYRYSAKIVQFIHQARLLADPRLTNQDEITSGDSFEAFWRTLIYNCVGDDPRQAQRPLGWVGISFGYWYMMSKIFLT